MTGRWVSRWFAIRAAVAASVCPEHERERRVFVRLCGEDAAELQGVKRVLASYQDEVEVLVREREQAREERDRAHALACEWQSRAVEHIKRVLRLENLFQDEVVRAGDAAQQVRALGAALRAVEARAAWLAEFAAEALDAHELGGGLPL